MLRICRFHLIFLIHTSCTKSVKQSGIILSAPYEKEEGKKAGWIMPKILNLMGWNFCKKALKKITHLFSAHMPRLTRIARSTVLRMQICFAWKSIWSCLKEARTALLLSPPRRLARGSLLPSISSRVENIFTSSVRTNMRSVAPPRLQQLPQHRGPICRSRGPELAAPSASGTRGPSTVCTVGLYMQRTGTQGIIIFSVGRPLILSSCQVLLCCRNARLWSLRVISSAKQTNVLNWR